MKYVIYEHNDAVNFWKKHKNNKKLIERLFDKYDEIQENPHHPQFKQLKSTKCPKCRRARVGNYRIIFYVSGEIIEVVSIISRRNDYQKY